MKKEVWGEKGRFKERKNKGKKVKREGRKNWRKEENGVGIGRNEGKREKRRKEGGMGEEGQKIISDISGVCFQLVLIKMLKVVLTLISSLLFFFPESRPFLKTPMMF